MDISPVIYNIDVTLYIRVDIFPVIYNIDVTLYIWMDISLPYIIFYNIL